MVTETRVGVTIKHESIDGQSSSNTSTKHIRTTENSIIDTDPCK